MAHGFGAGDAAADLWLAGFLAGTVRSEARLARMRRDAGLDAEAAALEIVCCPRHTAMAKSLFPKYLAKAGEGTLHGLVQELGGVSS